MTEHFWVLVLLCPLTRPSARRDIPWSDVVFLPPEARSHPVSPFFLREVAPPGRGCVVQTFSPVSAPSHPRHLSRSQQHAPATHVNSGAAGLRPPPLFRHNQNKSKLPRHPVCSPVASRVSALLLLVGRDAVGPSSVPDGLKAKCSESWSG